MKQETIKTILENKKWVVNGVDIPLTDEQLKQFESLVEKPRHKMSKPKIGEIYYKIMFNSIKGYYVWETEWEDVEIDIDTFYSGNCYLDFDLAEQIAMDRNLQDKLRQFSYENGWKDEWLFDKTIKKCAIWFEDSGDGWSYITMFGFVYANEIYFKDEETCEKAIDEIVIPFCKANPTYRFNR